ncbi:MAG TPA: hypothetical protein PLY32_00520 [Salinivirgaceae bacterium]|nr:hypothetical protein [Salinivirgaceae bacterium]HQA75579.1 hypothetical protein [Salinivirgaceae bacterium]
MKKTVFLALALVGLMLVGFTSCSKECECQSYVNGEKVGSPTTITRESGKKCKDYNETAEAFGVKTEVKCK